MRPRRPWRRRFYHETLIRYSHGGHHHSRGRRRAAVLRLSVVTTLKLDYDGTFPRDFDVRLALAARVHRLTVTLVRIDRTRHGYHVVIVVRQRVAFTRVILLQAVLGSDWKRELFNSRRACAWRRVPAFWRDRANVLYTRHYRSV